MTRRLRNAAWHVASVLSMTTSACGLFDATGGGLYHETQQCTVYWSDRWEDNGLALTSAQPPCPFTVRGTYSTLTYAAKIEAPSSRIVQQYLGGGTASYIDAFVMTTHPLSQLVGRTFQHFELNPADTTQYVVEVSMDAQPGLSPQADDLTSMRDSLVAIAYHMYWGGISEAYKILPGRFDPNAQTMIGPSGAATGNPTVWRSFPSWDTSAYEFRWILDGQEVAGATGAQFTRSLSTGTHQLSNVMIRADATSDTVTRTVKAFVVNLYGPTEVPPFVSCSWSADADGGTAPYTYSWSAPGAGSSSGAWFDYANTTPSGGAFTVQLTVTDATGAAVVVSTRVSSSSSAAPCAS